MSAPALRTIVREKLLSATLDASGGSPSWKVLVLDGPATRVASSVMNVSDLMDARVSLIESLERRREPLRDMEAIYLLAPTVENAERVAEDFRSEGECLYARAHLLFLSELPPAVLDAMRASELLVSRVATLRELNAEVIAPEPSTFDLGMASRYADLYGGGEGGEAAMAEVTRKLLSLCCTLNEYPTITAQSASPRCVATARELHASLNGFRQRVPSWWFHGDRNHRGKDPATLLLVDRCSDVLSAVLHDCHYQGAVADLLDVRGAVYRYTDGAGEEATAVLSERDALWREHRHDHMEDVSGALVALQRRLQEVERRAREDTSTEALRSAIRALPDLEDRKARLAQHLHMSQQVMRRLAPLMDLVQLEEHLALGTDGEGRRLRRGDLREAVFSFLRDPSNAEEAKARLAAAYAAAYGGLGGDEAAALAAASPPSAAAVAALGAVGAFSAPEQATGAASKGGGGGVAGFFRRMGAGDQEAKEGGPAPIGGRFRPRLERVLRACVGGGAAGEEFTSMPSIAQRVMKTSNSVRRSRWPGGGGGGGGGAGGGANKAEALGRVIVFVFGGATPAELRAVQTVANDFDNREILVGGTSLLTPKAFLEELGALAAAAEGGEA